MDLWKLARHNTVKIWITRGYTKLKKAKKKPFVKLIQQKAAWLLAELRNPKSGWQTAGLIALASMAYMYRAKEYILKPQLFAEDGVLWLAEGYTKSIIAIFQPVNGFLHSPERLFGFIVARVNLEYAPIIFVVTAWLLFVLTCYYLLSSRTKILTNNFERLFMVGCLGLIANVDEIFFNFSNAVFLMGVIGVLIMIASKHRNRVVDVLEKVFFFLSCFTLPFAWFYLPIAVYERVRYKNKGLFYLYTSLLGTLVQIVVYISSGVERSPVTLASMYSKYLVLQIYNQLLVPALRFTRIDFPILEFNTVPYAIPFVFLAVASLLIATAFVLRRSNKQVWYLLFFLAAMTFASFKSPTVQVEYAVDALKHMAIVDGASRYFIYGILAVNIVVVKTAYMSFVPKARYLFMVVFLGFGFLTSLQYGTFFVQKEFTDYTQIYTSRVREFQDKKVQNVVIPVNPYPWRMYLTQRSGN